MMLTLNNKIAIEFNEEAHTYTIGSSLVPGSTTIIGVLNKPFLVPWSAKMVWSVLTGKHAEVVKMSEEEYEKFILEAKGAAGRKSKGAKGSGSLAHGWVEQFILSAMEGKVYAEKLDDVEAQHAVDEFLKWEQSHKVEYLSSELVLGSAEHQFGGKIDCVALVDGEPSVLDWKTSTMISNDMFLQLAGYSILLKENGAVPLPLKRIVVRLPKKVGEQFEEEMRGVSDYDNEIFLHCRAVERWVGAKQINNK